MMKDKQTYQVVRVAWNMQIAVVAKIGSHLQGTIINAFD